ncbi:hypothetical protein PINS_up007190 [Pythium insidiosum]|nr:hypothetical protein PINS_up007190 [Pythium insidiosum]
MASGRRSNYASRCETDSFEELSAKLTADLRNHVRFMADYPVLSDDWMQMAEQIGRIGEITEMVRFIEHTSGLQRNSHHAELSF